MMPDGPPQGDAGFREGPERPGDEPRTDAAVGLLRRDNARLEAELARLRAGIRAFLAGDYPDAASRRGDRCAHGRAFYEACPRCADEHFRRLLEHFKLARTRRF